MEANGSVLDTGSSFWGTGRWATQQLKTAMRAGKGLSTAALRTLDTLSKDEWKEFDTVAIQEAAIRLRIVASLIAKGLTKTLTNGLGKTLYEYEKMSDLGPASVSMSGITQTENDRQEVTLANLPLPIAHKDFWLDLRTITASRNRGEGLDTIQPRTAARVVLEAIESMFAIGGKTFAGSTIYGLTNHPQRNTGGYITNGAWSTVAKTGADIVADVLKMKSGLIADRMYGPYTLFIPASSDLKLDEDFKAAVGGTTRERVMAIDGVEQIVVADQLTADNIVMVQMTEDVIQAVEGVPVQTVQWDEMGGFKVNFKVFGIMVPLIRSDYSGRSGVYHMS